jgi:hypothetical protein
VTLTLDTRIAINRILDDDLNHLLSEWGRLLCIPKNERRIPVADHVYYDMIEYGLHVLDSRTYPPVSLRKNCLTPGCTSPMLIKYVTGVFLGTRAFLFMSCPSHRAENVEIIGGQWVAPYAEFRNQQKDALPSLVVSPETKTRAEMVEEEYGAWMENVYDPDDALELCGCCSPGIEMHAVGQCMKAVEDRSSVPAYCGSPEPTVECEKIGFCDYHDGA